MDKAEYRNREFESDMDLILGEERKKQIEYEEELAEEESADYYCGDDYSEGLE